MFDTHLHTGFSTDSWINLNDVMEVFEGTNYKGIVTEHQDLNYPKEGQFRFDVKKYFEEYSKFRGDRILLGMEMGFSKEHKEQYEKMIKDNPFDFIIGSVHIVNGIDLYPENFYKERSKKEAYTEYLKQMISFVKEFNCFDTLGHIDYICRYAKYEDKEFKYEDFSELIDELFKTLIFKEKAIEINTRRFGDKSAIEGLRPLYKRYHELGGRMVTIGSDAHTREGVAIHLKDAYKLSQELDLKPVYCKNRKYEYDIEW